VGCRWWASGRDASSFSHNDVTRKGGLSEIRKTVARQSAAGQISKPAMKLPTVPIQWRLTVALHEAAHLMYARRAGAIAAKYHGPLEYPGKPGVYGFAGIEPIFPETGLRVDIIAVARWFCAGDVVKRILAPKYQEDEEGATDYEVFCDYCQKLSPAVTADQLREAYEAAQRDVERDLRSPAFRRELWDLAREVEKKIPWDSDEVILENF
jgi:hypothetical protein